MEVIKPPVEIPATDEFMLFLGGSIEMGKAELWQPRVEEALSDKKGYILNPRRDDWDPSWEQTIYNPQFKAQVSWELEGLESCTLAFMYFAPGTSSPISLMELGTFVDIPQAIVCCPPGFWRKGNVDIFCERYGIPVLEDLMQAVDLLRTIL